MSGKTKSGWYYAKDERQPKKQSAARYRIDKKMPGVLLDHHEKPIPAILRDISDSGIGIFSQRCLRVDDRATFLLGNRTATLEIVWCSYDEKIKMYRYGLRQVFSQLPLRQALLGYLQSL